jgi:cbb3-type cytochrome oxidase maturation protein
MNIVLVLIPLSLLVLVAGIAAFFWAVNHSQFDDLDSPGLAPLLGDRAAMPVAGIEPTPSEDEVPCRTR